MVLKLYAHTISPPSSIVVAVLDEKQIPFEFITIEVLRGEQKGVEFLAKNPFGSIPCIDDNGFILYESRAICRYLEETYPNQGTKLIPSDPKKRAAMDQAIFTEVCNLDSLARQILAELFYKKHFMKTDPDEEKAKQAIEDLLRKFEVYERLLSKQKYIAGDELTLADFYHLPIGTLLPLCGVSITHGRPNVERWFNEISSRPSWQKVKDGLIKFD